MRNELINTFITRIAAEALTEELDLEARWNVFVKRTEATEEKFKPKLRTFFGVQERSVLSRMRRTPVPDLGKAVRAELEKAASPEARLAAQEYVDKVFDPEEWLIRFEDVELPFAADAFREAGQAVFVDIEVQAAFDVTSAQAQKKLKDLVSKTSLAVNDTTQARLRRRDST